MSVADYIDCTVDMLERRGALIESNAVRPNWVTDTIERRWDELNPGPAGPVRLWTASDCIAEITPAENRAEIIGAFCYPEDADAEEMLAAWNKFPWSAHR